MKLITVVMFLLVLPVQLVTRMTTGQVLAMDICTVVMMILAYALGIDL